VPPQKSSKESDTYDLENSQPVEGFKPSLLQPPLQQHFELMPPTCAPPLRFYVISCINSATNKTYLTKLTFEAYASECFSLIS